MFEHSVLIMPGSGPDLGRYARTGHRLLPLFPIFSLKSAKIDLG